MMVEKKEEPYAGCAFLALYIGSMLTAGEATGFSETVTRVPSVNFQPSLSLMVYWVPSTQSSFGLMDSAPYCVGTGSVLFPASKDGNQTMQ